ncbi:YiiX/YebB-like N1pC/P60 family cysteine hydrolase [Paenibacillus segetis]|uniref:Permuted papain-like amidase enzyme, YaeF/YiiX, C92 family n=1 Tax=Paenibacillus segetis TaxID=1325360 RepID=A0ABQ1YC18_9BACL|nr:YiiX/YebB-like N1pC/P60 family cysteine hydrolase [Paenibacillus segetis]GGH19888.1 hypothetical protein GCM10008013_16880 [Paenibacillus segetis]
MIGMIAVLGLILFLHRWTLAAEPFAHWTPDYSMVDLSTILTKDVLNEHDYEILLKQSGLGRPVVDKLLATGKENMIYQIQNQFFSTPLLVREKNSPISNEEFVVDKKGNYTAGSEMIALEDGDILITQNSLTFGWRNGHAAIVVDANEGLTLESAVLGENSGFQTIGKWEKYPSFLVFRLKNTSAEERHTIAQEAVNRLNGVPYGFGVGIWSAKHPENKLKETHCAHLVWEAYRQFGYDLDSNGGRIITPKSIANSPLLELIQVYGMNPKELY